MLINEKILKSHKLYFGNVRGKFAIVFKREIRTQPNIYDGAVLRKIKVLLLKSARLNFTNFKLSSKVKIALFGCFGQQF